MKWYSNYTFLKKVDQLPKGPDWQCGILTIKGDRHGDNGKALEEQVELWFPDPIECVRELIGNPAFDGNMAYAPERVYADGEGKE
jgi:hypothetical protein